MELNQIKQVLSCIKNDHLNRQSAFFVLVCVFSSLFISYSLTFLLIITYLTGIISCSLLVKFRSHTKTSLNSFLKFYKGRQVVVSTHKLERPCSVCDDSTCRRHQIDNTNTPWKDLVIDEKLNEAVEQFFKRILRDFVSSWYENLSHDDNFINEIQYALKYSTATLIKSILELDLANLISKKLLPCAIKHVDDYMYIEQIAKLKNARINDVIVEYLGKRLHPAATCRNYEVIYLRELTGALLPFVLPKNYQNCRNFTVLFQEIITGWVFLPLMDVLANPDIINSLIIISTNYKTKLPKRNVRKPTEYLKNFTKIPQRAAKSIFHKDLNEIKEDTGMFYMFMKFLKNEGNVHLLQFCLDFDEFNQKLMSPDLSAKNLEELFNEAKVLNREYISKDGPNFVRCNEDISKHLGELLEHGVLSIAEVKVSGPLIQAYKEVFDNLEENWLPLFFESDEFYSYLCGEKITARYNKTIKTKNRNYEPSSGMSKLSRLKSALKNSSPVEGSIYHHTTQEVAQPSSEDEIPITTCYSYNFFRDISTWDISITSYVSLNKVIYFHIVVKRPNSMNVIETQRVVLRKDQDFFTLKAKLCEFHGENEISDSPLPARKAGSDITARMIGYERFLKKLLQNASLRGSDLLYTFLTIKEDFSMYISTYCGAPVQDLSNIYQNVAQKLRKEKGQHLDNFMNGFLASVTSSGGGTSDKDSKNVTEVGDEVESYAVQHVPSPKTYRNYVFNDNFGVKFSKLRRTSTTTISPENFTDCLFYLGKNIFHVPNTVLKLYVAVSSLISELMEFVWNSFLLNQLKYGLSELHLEYLMKFLLKVIFDDPTPTPSKLEMELRRKEVESLFESNVRKKFPYKLLGDNFFKGLKRLWDISQHPHYNKHLMYQCLDIILLELYPNLME